METNGTIREARALAILAHRGEALTSADRFLVNYWVNRVGPENFYMDGELFADRY